MQQANVSQIVRKKGDKEMERNRPRTGGVRDECTDIIVYRWCRAIAKNCQPGREFRREQNGNDIQ